MITKDNIQKVLLDLRFFSNHGVYTRHYGSADEGFDLEYNYNTGKFNYPVGLQADRNTTQEDYQKESYVVFVCVAQLFERGYLPQHIKLEGRNYAGTDMGYCDILVSDNNGEPYLIVECKKADIDKKEHFVETYLNVETYESIRKNRIEEDSSLKFQSVFSIYKEAVREAKKHYNKSNGCYYCCKECHTS